MRIDSFLNIIYSIFVATSKQETYKNEFETQINPHTCLGKTVLQTWSGIHRNLNNLETRFRHVI